MDVGSNLWPFLLCGHWSQAIWSAAPLLFALYLNELLSKLEYCGSDCFIGNTSEMLWHMLMIFLYSYTLIRVQWSYLNAHYMFHVWEPVGVHLYPFLSHRRTFSSNLPDCMPSLTPSILPTTLLSYFNQPVQEDDTCVDFCLPSVPKTSLSTAQHTWLLGPLFNHITQTKWATLHYTLHSSWQLAYSASHSSHPCHCAWVRLYCFSTSQVPHLLW